jgi:hypothetical protein
MSIADEMSRLCGVLSHYLRSSEPVSARGKAIEIEIIPMATSII